MAAGYARAVDRIMPPDAGEAAGKGIRLHPDAALDALVAAVVAFGAYLFIRNLTTDSFYLLYAGRWIAHHGIPYHNSFTTVAHGHRWLDQQWLGQLVGFQAWRLGGYPLLIALSDGCLAATGMLVFRLLRGAGVSRRTACATTFGILAVVVTTNASVRTQTFAYPLFAMLLIAVLKDRAYSEPRRLAYRCLPVLALWANVHGSVLLAAAVLGGYALTRFLRSPRQARGYLLLAAASAVSPLATPYGLRIIGYYRSLLGQAQIRRYVAEWQPPELTRWPDTVFWAFVAVAAITLTVGALSRHRGGSRPQPFGLALGLLGLAAAVQAIRFEAWFALSATVPLADVLRSRAGGALHPRLPWRTALMAGVVAVELITVTAALLATRPASDDMPVSPEALAPAAAALTSHAGSCVTADPTSATELLWFYPNTLGRVAYDIRYEDYSATQLGRYFRFLQAPGDALRSPDGCTLVAASRRFEPSLCRRLRTAAGSRVLRAGREEIVATVRGA